MVSPKICVAMHCHYMDVTETLAVTKNEHIEIVGKGDLGFFFFLLFTFRWKLMTCISFCDKLDDIF